MRERLAFRHVGVLLVLFGCTSEVVVTTAGNGGMGGSAGMGGTGGVAGMGGAGGAMGGSGGSTAGSGGAITGGMGGAMGNLCDQGCQHAADCFGMQVCGFIGIDCSTGMFECQGQCIIDADCAALASLVQGPADPVLSGCLDGCMGGGGGGAGGSMGGDCQGCTQNNCLGAANCNFMGADAAWAQCALGCLQNNGDPSCFDGCNQANPNSAPCFSSIYSCQCTSCAVDCAAVSDPCNQPGGMMGGGGAGGGP